MRNPRKPCSLFTATTRSCSTYITILTTSLLLKSLATCSRSAISTLTCHRPLILTTNYPYSKISSTLFLNPTTSSNSPITFKSFLTSYPTIIIISSLMVIKSSMFYYKESNSTSKGILPISIQEKI